MKKGTMTDIEKIVSDFRALVKKQKNGGNPYWPDWESVENFLTQSLQKYGEALEEKYIKESARKIQTAERVWIDAILKVGGRKLIDEVTKQFTSLTKGEKEQR